MENYSNKLGKIKFTIEELRNDIEKMKLVINNSYYFFQKNDKAIGKINSYETPKIESANKIKNLNKNYSTLNENRNTNNKMKNNANTHSEVKFNTQKVNNYNFNDFEGRSSFDNIQDIPNKKIVEKYKSIEGYDYINYDTKEKNRIKKNKDNKDFHSKEEDIKENKKININEFYINEDNKDNFHDNKLDNNNNYNNLSNMIKNKKMISSPLLDSNFKKRHLKNCLLNNNPVYNDDNENNDNDIMEKNSKENEDNDKALNYEIEKIRKEIETMQANNKILLNKLNEEKNKNSSLISFNNDENIPNNEEIQNILINTANYLQVNSIEEIVPKLNEMIEYLNLNIYEENEKNKMRNELISKLKDLYISVNNSNEIKEQITIKVLWRWIKHLINTYKSLLYEKDKKVEFIQKLEKKDNYYKECCDELMNKYNIQNLEDLNKFIEELIKRNNINRKRVEQLKKILVDDSNQSKSEKNLKVNYKHHIHEDIKLKKNFNLK